MKFNAKPFLNRNGITYEFIESNAERLVLQEKRTLLKTKGRKVAIMRKDDLYYLYAQIGSQLAN
jgi:hypothetical protein